jgi:hypothetical protein
VNFKHHRARQLAHIVEAALGTGALQAGSRRSGVPFVNRP